MITPGALARFQDNFSRALLATDAAPIHAMAALAAQPGFAVYRNTVFKGCIDALQANYPVVTRLVGEEWFRAAATIYMREALPGQPMLLEYGAGFADFLTHFEPAAELPYLPGVAQLDRFWTEAHIGRDDAPLKAAAVEKLASGNFFHARLQPHAAARWAWFEAAPIYTIWSRNRSDAPVDTEIEWHAEGALLTRPRDTVQWVLLDRPGCAFLDVCAAGGTVAAATQAALEVDDNADLAKLISIMLDAGAFSQLDLGDHNNFKEEQQ